MNQGRTVFSQLISFLPDREFRRCVARYEGDLRRRGFTCWDQYLAMAFAQLTYHESLRNGASASSVGSESSSSKGGGDQPKSLGHLSWFSRLSRVLPTITV